MYESIYNGVREPMISEQKIIENAKACLKQEFFLLKRVKLELEFNIQNMGSFIVTGTGFLFTKTCNCKMTRMAMKTKEIQAYVIICNS